MRELDVRPRMLGQRLRIARVVALFRKYRGNPLTPDLLHRGQDAQFVIDELQLISDSADKLKRNRGRRGLDVLQKLRDNKKADVILYDSSARDPKEGGREGAVFAPPA